ncbi:MAG: TonB-dependent receptor [Sphingorhabdus sp.]|uniref:TonB-dependent receptor domain-containing protein n=1 Tax=Sphingorhabdus sp. TaxID=1902408 RepID=UPI003C903F73
MKKARLSILKSTTAPLVIGLAMISTPVFAQDAEDEAADEGTPIVVTGSRIARPNLDSNSPVAVVTGEQTVANADVTLDTFLNTLPGVNPAGTTTSNNPGNGGQSNIDLRGLGANRNLVLVNGRRPMVSASNQTVDLNTIPQGLIERIDVTTGGAGAAYGADAIAGVVNMILKDDFEGLDLRATYSNTIPETDAREYQISGLLGGNFADGRGNIAISAEYSNRQGLIKAQRPFASQATSTTGTFPTGRYTASPANPNRDPLTDPFPGNPIPQSAIDALFASYGSLAKDYPTQTLLGFNSDGSLFGVGTFNSPRDVANYRYGPGSAANENLNFFPDFYTYNFDIVNILVLPLERKSAFLNAHYEINDSFDFFVQGGYTNYNSATALAPTPLGVNIRAPGQNSALQASSPLISATGCRTSTGAATSCSVTGIVVPTTNPFIPADLRTLLNARTGDSPRFVGSGAGEAFAMGYRFLGTGLREQALENEVLQGLVGLRGQIAEGWRYETYYSWGQTTIDQEARGNVNVQRVQQLLEAADGGASLCAGGFNPFGIQPLSPECVAFVDEVGKTKTTFTQKVAQAYVTGELAQLPGGPLGVVLGVESRKFRYAFDPGSLFGPIAGFNTATPDLGTNTFLDFFGEVRAPIMDTLELSLTARSSKSDFNDIQNGVDGAPSTDWAYGGTVTWSPIDAVRLRASYQHSVRAPNFGELFSGGGSFPQIFDPCSVGTNFRTSGGATASALCSATGLGAPATFAATPGAQAFLTVTGNPNLKPEKSDTFTVGTVFNAAGFTGSIDYYNIKVTDTIYSPDVNEIIATCYGYNGINTTGATSPYCSGLSRGGGSDITAIYLPPALGGDPATGYFQAVNLGSIKTSGVDVQLGYRLPTPFVSETSAISANLLLNYLIDWKSVGLGGLTTDYAGSASYFGAGLGTSFPRWKGTMNLAWSLNENLKFDTRVRYIHKMVNRAAKQFPGETFRGPGSIWYFDFGLEANVDALTFRLGLNNAFDRQPETYAPNVQSGTDPSLYDVLGRRAYVSARLKF